MPVTPEEILDAAVALYGNSNGEAERRSSASRSYYGFYHFANQLANGTAQVPPSSMSGPTHATLSSYFSSSNEQPRERMMKFRQVGILLRQCHATRCDADYKLEQDFTGPALDVLHRSCLKGVSIIKELG